MKDRPELSERSCRSLEMTPAQTVAHQVGWGKKEAFISYESGKSDYAGSMITLLVKPFIKVHLNVSFVLCYSHYGIGLNACLDL